MSLSLKENVRFGSNGFAMAIAAIVANDIFKEAGYDCVITSANDSQHGANSFHSHDGAIDLRTKHIPEIAVKQKIVTLLKQRLTNDAAFDIVFEDAGGNNEHIHIEYDVP